MVTNGLTDLWLDVLCPCSLLIHCRCGLVVVSIREGPGWNWGAPGPSPSTKEEEVTRPSQVSFWCVDPIPMVPIQCWSNFSGMEHQKSNYSQSDTWAQMLNWTSRHPENKDTASDSPRYVGGEIGLILVSVNSPRWSIGIDIGHP